VRSGLSVLGVSIDGPDQETYETYRVRGRLDQVLKNARLVVDAKRRLGSDTPRVIWTYLVFKYNERRVGEARRLATRLGLEFSAQRGLAPDNPAWETTAAIDHPAFDLFGKGRSCRFLYSMAAVNADLGVSPCCSEAAFESADDFGTVRDQPFRTVWNGTQHRAARRLFRALKDPRSAPDGAVCCERCSIYTLRRDDMVRRAQRAAAGTSSTASTIP
jgi:MoaA/NifB/PqqE/SkfB family radical SAM enzyme